MDPIKTLNLPRKVPQSSDAIGEQQRVKVYQINLGM